MSDRTALLALAVFACCLSTVDLEAHEKTHTHPALAAASLDLYGDSELYDAAARASILHGSIIEDDGERLFVDRFCWHFYNPLDETGNLLACDLLNVKFFPRSARTAAVLTWPIVPSWEGAFEDIGRLMHLIQDMTSPAHIHDDPHGGIRPCLGPGKENRTTLDDFEIWGWDLCEESGAITSYVDTDTTDGQVTDGAMTPLLVDLLELGPGHAPRLPVDLSPGGFIDAAAKETFGHTTFPATLTYTDPQPNSELSKMFPGALSTDFVTPLAWRITGVGNTNVLCSTGGEWWPMEGTCIEGENSLSALFYIENSGGLGQDYLTPAIWGRPGPFQTDSNLRPMLQIYGHTLYPLAVAYGAGLLKVFEEIREEPLYFDDLPTDHWADGYVRYLRLHGVIDGYQDGTFRPDQQVTRAEALKIGYAAAAEEIDHDAPSPGFADVNESDWFYPYVADARAKGFIEGTPCGDGTCFYPHSDANRAEALKVLAKLFRVNFVQLDTIVNGPEVSFIDVPAGAWFLPYVRWATRSLLVNGFSELGIPSGEAIAEGYSDGLFRPEQLVTRGEMAKMATGAMLYCRATTSISSCRGDTISAASSDSLRIVGRQMARHPLKLGTVYEHPVASTTPNLHEPPPFVLPGGNSQVVSGPLPLDDGNTTDADGDRLYAIWTATGGSLSTYDPIYHSTATWTPPNVEVASTFRVYVQRSDDRGKVTHDELEFTVLPTVGGGGASGTITAPIGAHEGAVTVSADVADPDGLARVSVSFTAGGSELVLCGSDGPELCTGTSATLSRSAISPGTFDASDGTVTLTLFVEDTAGNREPVSTHSFSWESPSPGSGLTLTVIKEGDGDGTVSGSGIDCPQGCRQTSILLPEGTLIDLAGSGAQFLGFSGEICYGPEPCSFTLFRDTTVYAGFALPEAFQALYSRPASGETGVAANPFPCLFFNRNPSPGPGIGSISFTDEYGAPVSFQPVVGTSDRRLVLVHDSPLAYGRRYQVQVPADAVVDEANTPLAAPWGISFTVDEEGAPNMYLAAYPPKILEGDSTKVSIWFEKPATTDRDIDLFSNGDELELPSFVTLKEGESLVELTVRAQNSPGDLADVVEDLQATDSSLNQTRSVPIHVFNNTPLRSDSLAWLASSVFDDEDGDGNFESGETAEARFEVTNHGQQGISGIYLEFEVLDTPNLRILGGTLRCDIGFLDPGRSGSCTKTLLADDDLPSGQYAIRVRGYSSGGNITDIAPIQVVNTALPNFQISTGAVTSNFLDPGRTITMSVTARNRGDGFSLDLPTFEVLMEVEGVEIVLHRIHAEARGDIFSSQSFDLPITAPSVPGSYPIRARINPAGPDQLSESNYGDNEGTERILNVASPNRAPILQALGGPFAVAAGELLTIGATATDEDGDSLTYHLASDAPAGMEVDATTGVITWDLPCYLPPGTYAAELVVEDPSGASDSGQFSVETQRLLDLRAEFNLTAALATPGQEMALEFRVINQGPSCASALTAEVTPGPNATVTGWTCTATPGSDCSPGQAGPLLDGALSLAVGGAATYPVTVLVDDAATGVAHFEGSAELPPGTLDPNATNDLGTATVSLRSLDYGDAPDNSLATNLSFPTTLANDGARHGVTPGLVLGDFVDGESDGQPSYGATGDDSSGSNDEDGVAFLEPLVPCSIAAIKIQGTTAGLLSAWIDFGRDGSWKEAGDQIATDRPLPSGISEFDIQVPCSANPGTTYSRFRLSSGSGLAPGGLAIDGEVEDHTVEISPLMRSLEVTVDGTGSGEITLYPGGIACGNGCSAEMPDGTVARLAASALPGSIFGGWDSDECSGTMDCALTLDRDRAVVATFALDEPCFALELGREGTGTVPAASPDQSAGCGPNQFLAGEQIQLTASPGLGWAVASWLGTTDDTSSESSNELIMPTGDHQVLVRYAPTGDPTVLLVDDDDGDPDVRAAYTEALDSLGVLYDVWDTQGTDDEPAAEILATYPSVIWFTGGAFRDSAGPGDSEEIALGTYLDGGGCLVLSSQDYLIDRGQTSFMSQYLGLLSGTNDAKHDSVLGQGDLFEDMGPFTLSHPPDRSPANFSDLLLPTSDAGLAFLGDGGEAAIYKATPGYRTIYLGFPLEALASPTAMRQILQTSLDFCDRSCNAPYSVDLSSDTIATSVEVVSCNRITAGDGYLVLDGGAVTLRAPGRVVLRNGFSIEEGGTLRVVIEP